VYDKSWTLIYSTVLECLFFASHFDVSECIYVVYTVSVQLLHKNVLQSIIKGYLVGWQYQGV